VQHLDPDRLVILALGESVADDAETTHLTGCATCQTEYDALRHVAGLGAETQGLHALPPPPERVWSGIATEVAQNRTHTPEAVRAQPPARRNTGRWLAPVLSAAAAAVLAIVGTVTVIRLTDKPPPPRVTAQAALAPLPPAPPSAHGDAKVLAGDELQIDVRNLPLTTGYYEVWLINPENLTKMQSIGNLPASAGAVDLPIPPGTDLNKYRLVDVSAEQHDGNSAHSGKSLLRGTLTD